MLKTAIKLTLTFTISFAIQIFIHWFSGTDLTDMIKRNMNNAVDLIFHTFASLTVTSLVYLYIETNKKHKPLS